MEGGEGKDSQHVLSALGVGLPGLLLALAGFLGIAGAGSWDQLVERSGELAAGSWGDGLRIGLASLGWGMLYGSGSLVGFWFLGYSFQEVKAVIAEQFKKQRFDEGFAQGRVSGRAEGRADRDREWADYLARQAAAAQAGQPFNEPTPAERERNSG